MITSIHVLFYLISTIYLTSALTIQSTNHQGKLSVNQNHVFSSFSVTAHNYIKLSCGSNNVSSSNVKPPNVLLKLPKTPLQRGVMYRGFYLAFFYSIIQLNLFTWCNLHASRCVDLHLNAGPEYSRNV